MKNLDKIFKEYLNKKSDYAIQIVGSWGCGKTYYYRNTLEKLIIETPSLNNNNKKYKPIYISLFGLKSIEDIATKIVFEFYQSKLFKQYYKKDSDKKTLKVTQSVFKIGLRGFLNFNNLGNANEYLTDIKNIGKTVLDSSELVICFDDLERKDSSLDIHDLIGYVNSFVDESIKVIIISNEDILLKSKTEYKNLKEKIIGITIDYAPDFIKTIENIIIERYSGYKSFKEFLLENISLIFEISQSIDNNFRHIIYALDCLQCCYSNIKIEILDIEHEINNIVERELKNISKLILTLAIDFKSSLIKNNDKTDFSDIYSLNIYKIISTNNKTQIPENKNSLTKFIERYKYSVTNYQYYESIFNYVTGFDEFRIELFVNEIKNNFHLEKGQLLPQYVILNELSYQNYFKLTDEEYEKKTLEIIDFAEKGDYSYEDYLGIMNYAERFDNLLKLDLIEIKDKLISGFKKSIEKIPYDSEIDFYRFEYSSSFGSLSENYNEIFKAGLKEIELYKKNKLSEKIGNIINFLLNDLSEFNNKNLNDKDFNINLSLFPILNYLDIDNFINNIKKSTNESIYHLNLFFKERYKSETKIKEENDSIQNLIEKLNSYQEELGREENNKIRSYLVSEFVRTLKESCSKIINGML